MTTADAATASAPTPLQALYRLRALHLRRQSAALYRRYGHVVAIVLALGGPLIVARPELLAGPLVHFRTDPADWLTGLACTCGWLAAVAAWASLHRDAIRGGALAAYATTLPLPPRVPVLVDLALLGIALRVCLLPFGAALLFAGRAHAIGGADGHHLAYLALLAVLTLAVARSAVFGATTAGWTCQLGGIGALAAAPVLGDACALLAAALLAVLLAEAADIARATPRRPVPRLRRASGGRGMLLLVRLHAALLREHHAHAAAVRLLLAALPQCAALWLIVTAGKHAEARVLVILACALSAALMAGFFPLFAAARTTLAPFLRSLPRGLARLVLAEHLLVLAVTALLFAGSALVLAAGLGLQAPAVAAMLHAGLYWLAWLPLFGLPVISRHRDGLLVKFALAVAALVIALYS